MVANQQKHQLITVANLNVALQNAEAELAQAHQYLTDAKQHQLANNVASAWQRAQQIAALVEGLNTALTEVINQRNTLIGELDNLMDAIKYGGDHDDIAELRAEVEYDTMEYQREKFVEDMAEVHEIGTDAADTLEYWLRTADIPTFTSDKTIRQMAQTLRRLADDVEENLR